MPELLTQLEKSLLLKIARQSLDHDLARQSGVARSPGRHNLDILKRAEIFLADFHLIQNDALSSVVTSVAFFAGGDGELSKIDALNFRSLFFSSFEGLF